jgi:hypothetical protein
MPQADELFCPGGSVPGGGTGGGSKDPCIKEITYTVQDSIKSNSPTWFWSFVLKSKIGCITGTEIKSIIDITHEIQFSRIDTLNYSLSLTKDQIINSSGEITAPDITLNKGLYRLNLFTDEFGLITWVFEVENNIVITSNQADFLTPTIYPVPITENQFQLKLEAAAKVKFTYKLYDNNMNEIYSKNFVIQKDEERTHTIKPHGNGNIPQGFLYNQFIFEDGSLKTITTIKN